MNTLTNTPSRPGTDLPKPNHRYCLRVLLITAIFLVGAITGTAGTIMVIANRLQHAIKYPKQVPERIARRLDRKLDLTDDQARQVKQILTGSQRTLMDIAREVQPRIKVQLDATAADIAAVLNELQREKWQKMFIHMREKWAPPLSKPPDQPSSTTPIENTQEK
jgi:uncharacterized membrane protein